MQQLCNDALKKDNTSWYCFSWDQNMTIGSTTDIIMLPDTIQALLNRDHHLRLLIVTILESWPVARRIVILPILLKSWPATRRIVLVTILLKSWPARRRIVILTILLKSWAATRRKLWFWQLCWCCNKKNCDCGNFVGVLCCNKKNCDCDNFVGVLCCNKKNCDCNDFVSALSCHKKKIDNNRYVFTPSTPPEEFHLQSLEVHELSITS